MTALLEVDENGTLTLPPDVLGHPEPHTHYRVEVQGEAVVLRPVFTEITAASPADVMPKPQPDPNP